MAPPAEGAIPVDNVQQLLVNALQDAGVLGIDEDLEPAMLSRAFRQANWLLAQWARKRWLVYRLADYSFITTGAQTYPVGNIGANVVGININPRPDRLEYAFLRFLGSTTPVDIPIDIIQSRENYALIAVKSIGTIAWRIFYDPEWPVGVLRPWPVPQGGGQYEIHCGFKVVLPRFLNVQDKINFPPEYEAALNYCLARRFRTNWQLPPDPEINALARDALNAITLANTAVGVLRMPAALRRNGGRSYDYRGDTNG